MESACPVCNSRLYEYLDGNWTEWICWRCGYYHSNTPAFQAQPHIFRDIVRKNGRYFMYKYTHYPIRLVSRS